MRANAPHPAPSPPDASRRTGLGCACVVAATFAAYWPALRAGFIWNDSDYVTRPGLQSVSGLRAIWFRLGATEQYYPVLHSAFWLEHRLWGDSPLGYHGLNVLLHAGAACLLAFALRELGRPAAPGAEWIAALLFALHPVCVESVAWVSEQKNTLSTVFYLLAGLLYLRWRASAGRCRRLYGLASLAFLLALFSKSVTATLPAALLVVAWWKRGRLSWRGEVMPLVPWFGLGAAVGLFTGWVERTLIIGTKAAEFQLGFAARCLVAGRAVAFYLAKLAWPHPLIFFYPRWAVSPGSVGPWLFPLAALGALAGFWLLRRRTRGPLATALYFVGTLFPVLGFLDVYAFRFSFVADHFQYLAILGPAVALAAVLPLRIGPVPRAAYVAAPLCLLGGMSFAQCRNYRDLETFYRAILARNPGSWIARNNLGSFLLQNDQVGEAASQFRAALEIKPVYPEAENNLGVALERQGRLPEAIACYRAAGAWDPRYAAAWSNLGEALLALGRKAEAAQAMEKALGFSPGNTGLLNKLGPCLYELGRTDEAIAYYRRGLEAGARDPATFNNFGGLLLAAGRLDEAAGCFEASIRLDPGFPQSHENLGAALAAQGRYGQAAVEFLEALRRQPDNARVRNEWAEAASRSAGASERP